MKCRTEFVLAMGLLFLVLVCLPVPVLAQAGKEKTVNVDGIDLVLMEIPAGEFLMGSPGDTGMPHERPQHKVVISKPFYLGKYEVTQLLWIKVMGSNPSYFKRQRGDAPRPVETVSWDDAQEFIAKLNSMTGQKFRLPTEAEWEYACRAGSTTKYFFGDDPDELGGYAWYGDNSDNRTHPVGQKKPNGFGLYDINGNVWEWCADRYGDKYYTTSPERDPKGPQSGKFRILRGGGWHWSYIGLRCAHRYFHLPSYKYANIGLRLAQDKS